MHVPSDTQAIQSEKTAVRDLARRYADLANSPEQEVVRRRWRDTYMLRKSDRVPVWLKLDPMCWNELLPEETLVCTDERLRAVERFLRRALRQHEFGDDTVMLPYWNVPAAILHEGEHLWGVPIRFHRPESDRGAWAYDPPLAGPEDLPRLVMPSWYHDEAETDRRMEFFSELFEGILPVRLQALPPIFPGVGRNASDLMGLDALLINMALMPEFVHGVMAFLRDSVLQCIDQVERMGIMTENYDNQIHFSESLKTTPADVQVRASDLWFRTESQQFQGVSPAMWREFCLDYQRPIMERYRYVSYGCCEDLTDRIRDVLAIPNLRIFVNSPWTDLGVTAEECRDEYCIIWRQKATDVIYARDLESLRAPLEEGMRVTAGRHRAIVLQEVATLNGRPDHFTGWVNMAKEISGRMS